jgi:hypothetical protein
MQMQGSTTATRLTQEQPVPTIFSIIIHPSSSQNLSQLLSLEYFLQLLLSDIMISMQLETSMEMIIIIIFHHCFICGSSYLGRLSLRN